MEGQSVVPDQILTKQKEFVSCLRKLEKFGPAHWLLSPLDFLSNKIRSSKLESRANELGKELFDFYELLLVYLHQFNKSDTKEDLDHWLEPMYNEMFDMARKLGRDYPHFAPNLWHLISRRVSDDVLIESWKKKFLLLQFLGDLPTGPHKQNLWSIVYGGKIERSDPGLSPTLLLEMAYPAFLDLLQRRLGDLENFAEFDSGDIDVIRSRNVVVLDEWLLPPATPRR